MKTFGFIGCGNMASALLDTITRIYDRACIYISEHTAEKTVAASKKYGCSASNAEEIARVCDFIVLGVKPQALKGLLSEISPYLSQRNNAPVIVSMAAGVDINSLRQMSGGEYPTIRIMPNLPVAQGKGCTLYCKTENVKVEDAELFREVMSGTGILDEIPEKLIDAGSAVSGCGPAFVCMFIQALADGAVACGLPRSKAQLYAEQTVLGTAEYLLKTGEHPEKLKDAVCSPAGSTIEGVKALEEGAFRADTFNAVYRSFEKTRKLGK